MKNTLVEILRRRAENQAGQLLYTFLADGESESGSLTYAGLDRRARAIAAYLQEQGLAEERAVLLFPAGLEYVTAFFACLYANVIAVPSPLPHRNRIDARLRAIAGDAQAVAVLTTEDFLAGVSAEQKAEFQDTRWLATEQIGDEWTDVWRAPGITGDTLAFLQYTSGSTGVPKGVMVSHHNLLQNSKEIRQRNQLTPDSLSVSWLPVFHDMGLVKGIIQPLYTGFRGVLMPPVAFLQKPLRWLQAISDYRATQSGGPNFAYDLCVDKITPAQKEGLDLSTWVVAYNAAEPIRRETLERFARAFAPCGFRSHFLYPGYGLAENTVAVSGCRLEDEPVYATLDADALEQGRVTETNAAGGKHLVGCGYCGEGESIRIVDPDTLRICAPERVGEIWLAGPSVAQGYWHKPEETRKTFQAYLADNGEGPFLRTGDLGFLKNRELFVTGRIKDLLIIKGRNYYPHDLEASVERSHAALHGMSGAAFAVEREGEERLIVVQEVKRPHLRGLNTDEVAAAVRLAVSEQHGLSLEALVLLKPGGIPKTSSGKIQRRACRAFFLDNTLKTVGEWRVPPAKPAPTASGQTASDDIRHWLREKVSRHAGIPLAEVDEHKPFSFYGLDSVAAVGLSGELSERLARTVPPTLVYDHPSIDSLARYLAHEVHSTAPAAVGASPCVGDIAVIGMACRFPGAPDIGAFL